MVCRRAGLQGPGWGRWLAWAPQVWAAEGERQIRGFTLGQLYWAIVALLIGAATTFIATSWHLYHVAAADLWQHLAAVGALIDDPIHPTNPFVASDQPSRLFGPYWLLVGSVANLTGMVAPHAFVLGSVLNLALLAIGIWILGRAIHGGPSGALALLAAMLGGWLLGPNFTGYHDPLTLLTSAGYPAVTAVAACLILWGLAINFLGGAGLGATISAVTALAFATHPLGTCVGIAGVGTIALFAPGRPAQRRAKLLAWLALGLAGSMAWPYFHPFDVVQTAGSGQWGVGIDFYHPLWIATSLFPAGIGFIGLLRRDMRPFLVLFAVCAIGFALGATPLFVAGHRLLSFTVLVLHIGLSVVLLDLVRGRSRLARIGQGLAIYVVVINLGWTALKLQEMQAQERRDGNLLAAATELTHGVEGGFAGLSTAAFPIAATGKRVLSTPFAEPLVPDFEARQAATEALFNPALDAPARAAHARSHGVRYLVVDARYTAPALQQRLAISAIGVKRIGSLIRYQLY